MPQQMPVVRQLAWGQLIPQALAIGVLALLAHAAFPSARISSAILGAALVYLVFCRISRAVFLRDHQLGIGDYRAGRFADALKHFEASRAFFVQHPRLDSFRSLLFGVAGPNPFRIVALCNMAYCHSQLGEGDRAISLYEQALSESPDCALARASLNMLRSTSLSPDATQRA
jgi:tetratricopeptide (TPR) repeat protein